jgi:hypothetical protein
MLAVIPARTDPTAPLLPQAFQNMFFQFSSAEIFIRGLARRDSEAVTLIATFLLLVLSSALLVGGLPSPVLGFFIMVAAGLGALVRLAHLQGAEGANQEFAT